MIARDRVEHAAKYGAHLVIDARELLALLDQLDAYKRGQPRMPK